MDSVSGQEKNANLIKVNPDRPEHEKIKKAAEVIRNGGLVAFPTETVYGLGANALDREAVNKIFAIKKRPSTDPIIVHISDLKQLDTIVKNVPEIAKVLAKRFWPGPLTLIMERSDSVPDNVSAGLATVAVRMPSHPVSIALIKTSGLPIAAPSANIFSRPSSTKAQHIIDDFSDSVDLILDGGDSTIGVESTVLDLTSNPPVLLRPGGTPMEDLQEIIPDLQFGPDYIHIEEVKATSSPGQLTKHYSPNAKLRFFKGPPKKTMDLIRRETITLQKTGHKVGLLLPKDDLDELKGLGITGFNLGAESDLDSVARNLFSGLRFLDKAGVDVILVRSLNREGLGLAIMDRLIRASEGKIIEV